MDSTETSENDSVIRREEIMSNLLKLLISISVSSLLIFGTIALFQAEGDVHFLVSGIVGALNTYFISDNLGVSVGSGTNLPDMGNLTPDGGETEEAVEDDDPEEKHSEGSATGAFLWLTILLICIIVILVLSVAAGTVTFLSWLLRKERRRNCKKKKNRWKRFWCRVVKVFSWIIYIIAVILWVLLIFYIVQCAIWLFTF